MPGKATSGQIFLTNSGQHLQSLHHVIDVLRPNASPPTPTSSMKDGTSGDNEQTLNVNQIVVRRVDVWKRVSRAGQRLAKILLQPCLSGAITLPCPPSLFPPATQ